MKTKNRIWIFNLISLGLILILTNSCKKQTDQGQPPVLNTVVTSSVKPTTANSGGSITNDGGAIITARGVCWSITQNPTTADGKTSDGTGTGTFTSAITGLTSTTTYYVRAYATNSAGTSYGNELSFKTFTGTVSDVDGNEYNTITIGTQTWMAENLKTTKYRNSDLLGTTTPATLNITGESTPKYQWACDGNESNVATYGRLYTWYAVTDTRNVCPTGWHVPNDSEWASLATFLGGDGVAGSKLKETGTTHFTTSNTGATNETGFTALPGGMRGDNVFAMKGEDAGFWSSTEQSAAAAYERWVTNKSGDFFKGGYVKSAGIGIRCLKD